MHTLNFFHTCALLATLPYAQATLDPLLTSIAKIPDLSTFYDLFEGTGGKLGKPGPDFDERFNEADIGLPFTAFAPTNEALARLPPGLISALKLPHSYELLKSFLINHIAPGNLSDVALGGDKIVKMIGGFVAFDHNGGITTNVNLRTSKVPPQPQAYLIRLPTGELDCSPAFNGRVCKIDGILDGFLTYFGEDDPSKSNNLPTVVSAKGTMRDVIENSSELTSLSKVLKTIDPAFLTRLSLYSKDEAMQRSTVFLAPGNAAFEHIPDSAFDSMIQPSNAGFSHFLLEFGFGQLDDSSRVLRSEEGFNLTIKGSKALNGGITKRICADNGCVWVVGRLLDPFSSF